MSFRKVMYTESILTVFKSEIGKYSPLETGGVLLGRVEDGAIIIEKATDAGPNAIHEEFYFRADPQYIDMMIDIEYANSEGRTIYIGEWHTHPQVHPQPSDIDLNSLSEITESSGAPNLLLILGAIGFGKSKFLSQSISIIKIPGNSEFYSLDPILI